MLRAGEIRSLLDEGAVVPKRALGQNFVTDPLVIERIVDLARVGPGTRVLEVGPGVGSLTLGLLEAGAEVLAIEKDPALARVLRRVLDDRGYTRVTVLHGDALRVPWQDLLNGAVGAHQDPRHQEPWTMVSNLPYNVAVPILLEVLGAAPIVGSIWVMVQLEVAERLCARPGGRTIGVPTVKRGWYASARKVLEVPPEAFTPVPRVASAVVELHRRDPPRYDVSPAEVFGLVEAGFAKRRKMLRSSLASRVDPGAFEVAGIPATARPEELSVRDWADLAAAARELER